MKARLVCVADDATGESVRWRSTQNSDGRLGTASATANAAAAARRGERRRVAAAAARQLGPHVLDVDVLHEAEAAQVLDERVYDEVAVVAAALVLGLGEEYADGAHGAQLNVMLMRM